MHCLFFSTKLFKRPCFSIQASFFGNDIKKQPPYLFVQAK
jgi:hypothetical protein